MLCTSLSSTETNIERKREFDQQQLLNRLCFIYPGQNCFVVSVKSEPNLKLGQVKYVNRKI